MISLHIKSYTTARTKEGSYDTEEIITTHRWTRESTSVGHHNTTQNLKALGGWVLTLINPSTCPYPSNVGLLFTLVLQHSPSSVTLSL